MGTRLFVGNLSFETTQASLTEAFAQDGHKVVSVDIMADRATGRSRGFAFVEMASAGDAAAAITKMDGASVNGRPLRVSEAQERQARSDGGGPRRSDR